MTLPSTSGGSVIDYSDSVSSARTLDHLPTSAAERFAAVEARADAAFDSWPTRQRLMAEKADSEATLNGYLDRAANNADEQEAAKLEAAVDRARNAVTAFDQQSAGLSAGGRAWQATRTSCLRYINSTRNKTLTAVEVKIPSGADAGKLIDSIGDLARQIQEVEQAPLPLDIAIQQIRDHIDSLAYRGAPKAVVEQQLNGPHARAKTVSVIDLRWPARRLDAQPLGDDLVNTIDTEAVLAWAHRDAIQETAEADLEAFYSAFGGVAYTPDERRSRLAALGEEKLNTERVLSELLWQRIASGGDVTFPDVSPAAILGVS